MALSFSVLGQTADASTEVTLYTVPASTETKVMVTVTNRSGAATYRVALVDGGGATSNEHYVAYDEPIPANTSYSSRVFTISAADVVRVESSTANVSFSVTGVEQV